MFLREKFYKQAEEDMQRVAQPQEQEPESIPVPTENGIIEVPVEDIVEAIDSQVNAGALTEEEAMDAIEELEELLQHHFASYVHPGNGQEIPDEKVAEEIEKIASQIQGISILLDENGSFKGIREYI